MIVFTNDKRRIQKHCEKDPVLFAYHLGDLDDFYFPDCQWASIYGDRPHIEDLVLIYFGCHTPTVIAFGLTGRFPELLAEVTNILPDAFYCHFRKDSLPILSELHDYRPLGPHLKMSIENFTPVDVSSHKDHIRRLTPEDKAEVEALYGQSYPANYFTSRMLETGKYFGYIERDRIVAVSGVHVDSKQYRVAVLGNITTTESYRGRGISTALTSILVAELINEQKLVSLNVRADNPAAIRSYEKLGFVVRHEYEEGLFTRTR